MRTTTCPPVCGGGRIKEINMELIGKQIAIETILGQPPELHYPSWYAAQIEKLPPAPPEYLAEQAGILVTDADTISRQQAIDICRAPHMRNADCSDFEMAIMMLPPAQPKTGKWALQADDYHEYYECDQCGMAVGLDDVRNFCPNCGADMREVTT